MGAIRSRALRLVGGALVATAGLLVVAAPAAHAVTNSIPLNTTCLADLINNDGTTGGFVPPGLPFPLPTTIARVNGPAEINSGTSFNAVAPSIAVPVPKQVDTKVHDGTIGIEGSGIVNVWAASQIWETIKVTGASSIGTPTLSGGNVIGATVTKTAPDTILLKMPGAKATDPANFNDLTNVHTFVPGNENQFDAGKSFTSPKLTIPVTAGAAGTTVKFALNKFQADSDVDAFDNFGHIYARAFCTPDANLLGAFPVVIPPPPGAPDAVADSAQTDENTPVTINVLANDTKNAVLAIDQNSLAVTSNPGHGTAKVNADHTITYTPANGFFGGDSFKYHLCSVPEAPSTTTSTTQEVVLTAFRTAAVVLHCDVATVSVTVLAPQQVASKSETPKTVAAAAQLPKTGSSSTPLALVGFGLITGGLAITGFAAKSRRRRTTG